MVATEVIAEKAVEFPKDGKLKSEAIRTESHTALIGDLIID